MDKETASLDERKRSWFNGGGINTYTLTKIYVLLLARENTKIYAYFVRQEMKARLNWTPSDHSIIKVMMRMVQDGHLVCWWRNSGTHSTRFYKLTDLGSREWDQMVNSYRPAFKYTKNILDAAIDDIYGGRL